MSPRKLPQNRLPATGTCYACPVHGSLGVDVVILVSKEYRTVCTHEGAERRLIETPLTYCPKDDCVLPCHLIGRAPQAREMSNGKNWNERGKHRRGEDDDAQDATAAFQESGEQTEAEPDLPVEAGLGEPPPGEGGSRTDHAEGRRDPVPAVRGAGAPRQGQPVTA